MKQCTGDTEILRRAYAIFKREATQYAAELASITPAAKVTDLNKARNHAHRIKGGAGFFGLEELVQAAASVESLLKSGSVLMDPNGFKESLSTLSKHIATLPEVIESKEA